jgi:serine phosphatase RsbU (regulator of sigma subunit)
MGVYATAILAHVERDRLRWSNAGHPPPVLITPDGAARRLETIPNPLLGLGSGAERDDHSLELEPGATVVFYTDGLVERRRIPLQDRLEWLTHLLEGRHTLSAEALCDLLLAETADTVDDDVALLVLRLER